MNPALKNYAVREVLAANLDRERQAQGLSWADVCRKSRLSETTLDQIRKGESAATLDTIARLAKAVAVPIATLLSE